MKDKFKYDTHRDYLIKEFIFDDEIKQAVADIVLIYRDKFLPNGKDEKYISDKLLLMRAIPLLEELKAYYNNDICISCATGIAVARNTNFNLRTHAFYFENAIYRAANAWEYIHILINEILDINMCVGNDIRENTVNARCSNIYFEHTKQGYKLRIEPYTGQKLQEAKNKAEEEEKLLEVSINKKKSKFHKLLKKKRTINNNFQIIFDLFYSDEVKKLYAFRNESVHRRPIGAKFSVAPLEFIPGQGISINPTGWFIFKDTDMLLEKNMSILKEVIHIITDIIFNHDIPNTKENEGKVYYCNEIKCAKCKTSSLVPAEIVDFFNERNIRVACLKCGGKDTVIQDKIEVDDMCYYDNFWSYNEMVKRHSNDIFK
ncbi:hypothetical protein [Clostridium uliginosum]|uniref:Uncharacterized protein n=1 Tax=Clostridium uliginosum TaxID=119641 RepID=A0A1I1RKD9_9CLOT|nr:hypothetical protein [Clostridium uliginosum]SFD32093.1 hypothetical protein SAMN05421842_13217 [Clostridium uliginosum]